MPATVDIMFLTDATGSMATAIDDVKANMESVWKAAQKEVKYDIQVGVAWYRDVTDLTPYGITARITDNPDGITRAISGLQPQGGGDTPEAQLYALYQLAADTRAVGWRPGAMRYIAWFGDEPGHDPVIYPAGHPTNLSGTINELLEKNVIVMAFSMNPTNRLDSTGQATAITNATTGVLLSGVDQDCVVETIFHTIAEHLP